MKESGFSRRDFVRATGIGATAAAAGAGFDTASAQGEPEFPDYLGDARGGNFEDLRGRSELTVEVGVGSSNFAFDPTKIWIDPGTTVTFSWQSVGHNVLPKSTPSDSGWEGYEPLENSGFTYSHTFETEGIYTYFCDPHEDLGMKGGIAVGEVGGGGEAGGGDDGGGNAPPAWPQYVNNAKGGASEDARGQSEVTVEVGVGSSGLAFVPTNLWIDPGTELTFSWESTGHNVLPNSQPIGSDWDGHEPLEDFGFTYSHTFEIGGMYSYFCEPHEGQGMKGAIAVGNDVPRQSVDSAEPVVPEAAKTLVIATMGAMGTTLGLAYFFLKYGDNRPRESEV